MAHLVGNRRLLVLGVHVRGHRVVGSVNRAPSARSCATRRMGVTFLPNRMIPKISWTEAVTSVVKLQEMLALQN